MLYTSDRCVIYFGNKYCAVPRALFSGVTLQQELLAYGNVLQIKELLTIQALIAMQQVHGAQGYAVTSDTQHKFLDRQLEGDFLVTDMPALGLCVYTADCVPIVLYDPKKQCIGIIHAGWAGSVKQVASAALNKLVEQYKSDTRDIQVIFGPAARACCYQVGPEFKQLVPQQYIYKRDTGYYCDLVIYNAMQLQRKGIQKINSRESYAYCTICTRDFCSYRRDKLETMRQVTVVALKA